MYFYAQICAHELCFGWFSPLVMSDSCDPCQAPLSIGFSRQEYGSGLPFPSPGDLPNPGIEPRSPAFAGRFFTDWAEGSPPTSYKQLLCHIWLLLTNVTNHKEHMFWCSLISVPRTLVGCLNCPWAPWTDLLRLIFLYSVLFSLPFSTDASNNYVKFQLEIFSSLLFAAILNSS